MKGHEGFAPNQYTDSEGVLTICYGVTFKNEKDIFNELNSQAPVKEQVGAIATYKLLNERYGKVILDSCLKIGVTKQYQFDALTSFAYNLGPDEINNPKKLMRRTLDKGLDNEEEIRNAFMQYVHGQGGAELPGLKERRKEECDMFFGKSFPYRDICIIDSVTGQCSRDKVTENKGNGWLPNKC